MQMRHALVFVRENALRIFLVSTLVLVPCFWHKSIEAGDIPSDDKDLSKLCIRDLSAGEENGRLGYRPPRSNDPASLPELWDQRLLRIAT
jgi:hypothetical protein